MKAVSLTNQKIHTAALKVFVEKQTDTLTNGRAKNYKRNTRNKFCLEQVSNLQPQGRRSHMLTSQVPSQALTNYHTILTFNTSGKESL